MAQEYLKQTTNTNHVVSAKVCNSMEPFFYTSINKNIVIKNRDMTIYLVMLFFQVDMQNGVICRMFYLK